MIDLPLIFTAGFLGSSHCIGMCGPLALAVGSGGNSFGAQLNRQLVFSLGRIFTYTVFGATAGFAGWRITRAVPALQTLPALLAIVAGLFLIYQGLAAAGMLRQRVGGQSAPCLASTFVAGFLNAPGLRNAFLAGVFTGMLPCGLVYGFVSLAAATASLAGGAATMASFGAGTVPVMVLTGLGGAVISLRSRQRLLQVAAWCVVLAGIVSIARGLGFVEFPGWWQSTGCPLCN